MENKKIARFFKIKEGLKFVEPNNILSKSYFDQTKVSLLRAEKNLNEGDLLWATVAIYYADYYALYAFLQKIGIKSDTHIATISAGEFLIGEEKIKIISEHKDQRIDAQYYMKVGQKDKIEEMLRESKRFVVELDNIISSMSLKDIDNYRKRLKNAI